MKPKKEVTLSENSSRAAKARWAQKTPEERSAYGKMMVDAREAKRAATRANEKGCIHGVPKYLDCPACS